MYSYSKTNCKDYPHLVTRKSSRARDPLTTIYEIPLDTNMGGGSRLPLPSYGGVASHKWPETDGLNGSPSFRNPWDWTVCAPRLDLVSKIPN
jgi:hypothetical protein